ncbi:16S rRNA (cytosine(1402)-N(4))-methyltransferase RsmH [Thermodesulfobacteriota bacterium]
MAYHVPVMLEELLRYLEPSPGKTYVDCTLGGGGHTAAILSRTAPDGIVISIDQDLDAISQARSSLQESESRLRLVHDNFSNLKRILACSSLPGADGIVADLGLSLYHLTASRRGFSFQRDEPLDMRMDVSRRVPTAADIVNTYPEEELVAVFWEYGEERWARQVARRIVRERKKGPILTSLRLSTVVTEAIPRGKRQARIHPATRVFQSLRILVNRELEHLEAFLADAPDCLNPEGRICIISFHSLEDRLVKRRFRELERGCSCPSDLPQCVCGKGKVLQPLTRGIVRPGSQEVCRNPMARSARLRAAVKVA